MPLPVGGVIAVVSADADAEPDDRSGLPTTGAANGVGDMSPRWGGLLREEADPAGLLDTRGREREKGVDFGLAVRDGRW